MKLLFIFMDGVGLGRADPQVNPFVRAHLPNLDDLLEGRKVIADGYLASGSIGPGYLNTRRLSLLALDASLGVEGTPQSASGQASLLTGKNVAALIGMHDGPKPSAQVMHILEQGTIFSHVRSKKLRAGLLNAYPERYFKAIESGHRLPGAIAQGALYAGVQLRTAEDLFAGNAISVDLTGQGWRQQLGIPETPILEPPQAGERLKSLAEAHDLSLFEYWLSDVVGHQQDMATACQQLEVFDATLGRLVSQWKDETGLILITSDHGNMEDLSTRHHTMNDVPLILIGSQAGREFFIDKMKESRGARTKFDLTDVAPAILACVEKSI